MLGSAPACPYTYICVRTGSRVAKLFRANRRGNPFKTTSQSKKRPPKPFDAPPGPHIIPGTLRPKTNLQLSPSSKTSITFPYENGSQSADICERVRESASQAARAYRVPTRRFNSPLPFLPHLPRYSPFYFPSFVFTVNMVLEGRPRLPSIIRLDSQPAEWGPIAMRSIRRSVD